MSKTAEEKPRRVYRFKDALQPDPLKDRLVRAKTAPASTNFATRDRFSSTLASQDDMAELIAAGVKIEEATDEASE